MNLINEIGKIITSFETIYGFANLEDFVGSTLSIKIPRPGNTSIGFLYGFME